MNGKSDQQEVTRDPGEESISLFGHLRASIVATVVLLLICCGVYPLLVWGIGQAAFADKANGSLIKRDGSSTTVDADAVGSALLGQNFSAPRYFHPRPSAAGAGYDGANSSGSNLGPLSAKFLRGTTRPTTLPSTRPGGDPLPGPDAVDYDGVGLRVVHFCLDNDVAFEATPPIAEFKDKDGNVDDAKLVRAFNADAPLVVRPKTPIPADAVTASGSGLDPHISPENARLQAGRVAKARGIDVSGVNALVDAYTDKPDLGLFGDAGVNVLRLNIALDAKYPIRPAPTTVPAK